MGDTRKRAEELHTEAKIMHLDPDSAAVPRDLALGAAGVAVIQRTRALPAGVHAEDPRTVLSRVQAGVLRPMGWGQVPSYEQAVHMAALWTVLAAAIDRAEHADPTSGNAA